MAGISTFLGVPAMVRESMALLASVLLLAGLPYSRHCCCWRSCCAGISSVAGIFCLLLTFLDILFAFCYVADIFAVAGAPGVAYSPAADGICSVCTRSYLLLSGTYFYLLSD
jgi:hypothetical protein